MKRKKLSILILFMILVIVSVSTAFVACNDNTSSDKTAEALEPTEGLLISNSDFKVIGTTGSYPHTITDWTGGKLYSSSSVPGDVIAGAVSLEEALYAADRSLWNDDGSKDESGKTLYERLIAGGHFSDAEDAVNNVLMIHMPTEDMAEDDDDDYGPTAYGYSSKSFSLDAGSYYKLSVDVLTYDIAGTDDEDNVPGARIYLSSAGYAEISGIDTKGEWKTYTIYIESAATSSTSLTLNLGLGKYSSYYRDGLTSGYAFFDNVVLEKLADTDDKTAQAQYEESVAAEKTDYADIYKKYEDDKATADDEDAVGKSLAARYSEMTTRTMTLRTSNGRFDFGSTTIGTSAPSGWSLVTGDDAPTSYRFNGVIPLSLFEDNVTSYAGTYYLGTDKLSWSPALSVLSYASDAIAEHSAASMGDNVYMLSQQMMTAQGIRSSRQIVIEKNGLYAISVDVFTYNVYGAGVSLILSGDGKDIVIEGIAKNTNDGKAVLFGNAEGSTPSTGWTTYTFYIRGNQYKDMSYNMELWLGTGSAEENTETDYTYYSSSSSSGSARTTYLPTGTFSSGWAFFDDVTLEQYADEGTFDTARQGAAEGNEVNVSEGDAYTALYTDLTSESYFDRASDNYGGISRDFKTDGSDDEFSAGTLGKSDGWSRKEPSEDEAGTAPTVTADMVTAGTMPLTEEADTTGLYEALGITAPGLPYDNVPTTGMMITADENVAYRVKSGEFELRANSAYTVSVWLKTADVESGKGAYVYLMGYDDDGEETALASFTALNTETDDGSEWTEYTFYVKGSDEGAEKVWLELALGSGTKWSASTLASGTVWFANISMLDITYSDYSGASAGTYIKKTDLSTGTVEGSFGNGSFGNIDYDELEEAITASEDADGTLQSSDVAGVPEDWTLSDQTITENEDGTPNKNFVGGVIKVVEDEETPGSWIASTQINNLFGAGNAFFNNIYDATNDPYEAKGAPYILALAGLNGEAYSVGYLSDKFTLDASGNYSLSVWAKAAEGTKGMIYLTGEASGSLVNGAEGENIWFTVEGDGLWHKYTFNIEVGLTDVSLQLGLWLGENTDITGGDEETAASSGIILFDSVTLHEGLTDDELDGYTPAGIDGVRTYEEVKRITFFTDSFDTLEGETDSVDEEGNVILSDPNGWTGTRGTDQEEDDIKHGVMDVSDLNFTAMGPEPGEGETDTRVSYMTGFGPELDVDDFDATADEIDKWFEKNPDRDPNNDTDRETARAAIKQEKYYKAIADRMLPADVAEKILDGADGDKVLAINNMRNSAYRFGSASYTLTAETAYRITVRVFTYGIGHVGDDNVWTAADDRGAYIELYLGSADSSDESMRFENINTDGAWRTYTFVVIAPSDDVTNVSLRLGLGRYDADDEDALVSGYAFFDAVTIEEIGGENEYEEAVDAFPEGDETYSNYRIPEEAEQGATGDDDDTDTDVPSGGFNLDNLWWMIPTIVIGLAIIAVVIVFFVKKYKKKFTKKTPDEPTDSVSSANVRRKKDGYDDFNE